MTTGDGPGAGILGAENCGGGRVWEVEVGAGTEGVGVLEKPRSMIRVVYHDETDHRSVNEN